MTFAHLDSAILAALKAGERLTPAIAAERWKMLALHSSVSRLREQGHDIKCVMRSANGRRYGEYSLTGDKRSLPATLPVALRVRDDKVAGSRHATPDSPPNTAPQEKVKASQSSFPGVVPTSAVPPHRNCVLVETEGVGADGRRFTFSYTACMVDE